jgi:hypothetical protein
MTVRRASAACTVMNKLHGWLAAPDAFHGLT